jgi:hypothetical protein
MTPEANSLSRQKYGLLVIDDRHIWQEAFKNAEQALKKLDRLEAAVEAFHHEDQRLFNNWYELTFRIELARAEEARLELQKLVRLHNWMLAVAQILDLAMHEAFRIVKEEQEAYENGDERERQSIDCTRRERDDFIRAEMAKQFAQEGFDHDPMFDDEDPEEPDEEDFIGQKDSRGRTSYQEELFNHVKDLTDEKLREFCKKKQIAFDLLSIALMAETAAEFPVFFRVWSFTPNRLKDEFSRQFASTARVSLEEVMDDMRAEMQGPSSRDSQYAKQYAKEEAADGNAFSRGFIGSKNEGEKILSPGEELERLKLIYRKLVRRLHPDLQDPALDGKQSVWQKKIWDRAQTAYQNGRLEQIERLYKLTLLRQKQVNDLTLSEIYQSETWLKAERDRLELETYRLKRLPAWGFSRKKSFGSLEKKVRKELEQEIAPLLGELEYLREEHELLQTISHEYREGRRRKGGSRRKGGRRR